AIQASRRFVAVLCEALPSAGLSGAAFLASGPPPPGPTGETRQGISKRLHIAWNLPPEGDGLGYTDSIVAKSLTDQLDTGMRLRVPYTSERRMPGLQRFADCSQGDNQVTPGKFIRP